MRKISVEGFLFLLFFKIPATDTHYIWQTDILARNTMLVRVGDNMSTINTNFFLKNVISMFSSLNFLFVYDFMGIGWLGLVVNELKHTLF